MMRNKPTGVFAATAATCTATTIRMPRGDVTSGHTETTTGHAMLCRECGDLVQKLEPLG